MIPYLFAYDIPADSKIENPSSELRKIGFRVNKSCWVILEEDIPYPLIASLVEAGADCHTFRFDVREASALKDLATRELKRELSLSLATAKRKASEAAIEYAGGGNPADLAANHRAICRRLISTYRETISSLSNAASRFGISDRIGIGEAERSFQAMRRTLAATARNYMLDLAKVAKTFGADAMPIRAMKASQPLPPGILRDWMIDNDVP